MAEGTYEHACMRADLLGLDRPDKDEFLAKNAPSIATDTDADAAAARFEDISLQNEEYQQTSGGLSELNSILTGTQRKINRIKGMYGSIADLIKNKLGGSKDNMSYSTDPSYLPVDGSQGTSGPRALPDDSETRVPVPGSGSELHDQISSQVDKLDSMLSRAENAQCSLESQNKQMKKLLRK